MGTEERGEIIAGKCALSNCKDKIAARHYQLFVFENWDVHPPPDFKTWWARQPEAARCNVVTAWNTNRNRQQFRQWQNGDSDSAI